MEIADRVGWRRESINSLACEQFSPGRLEAMDARGLACVPDRQKFGYRDAFYIPPSLAIEIASFINDVRSTFLEEMGWFDKVATGPVFISARDGNGLTDKSISKIFGRAFAAAGAPRRAGIKSFRSKFANDAIAAETLARLELGLDTSAPSVAAAVSVDLGHSHPESIRAYVEQHQSRLASRKRNP
ncbi:hypothetical protein PPMP20_08990 [Paraburkholderia phymatum]|nr:hypothetical protein [Paraburkholderia phymatum]